MNSSQLINHLGLENSSLPNIEISGGKIDSRQVREGEIFLPSREIILMVINSIDEAFKNGASIVFTSDLSL